ncbi:unknown [Bacteroides sp. CAG:754]|nr:unknown [Bacteroides sp. CAG:754]
MVCRSELLYNRPFCEGYIIFISRDDFIRIFLCRLFNHLEQGRFLFYTIDDKRSAEDFVAAVFGVNLCETENFRVSQFTAEVVFHFLQIVHFFFRKRQAFFFIVHFEVFDIDDRFRLTVGREYILVESLVHAL